MKYYTPLNWLFCATLDVLFGISSWPECDEIGVRGSGNDIKEYFGARFLELFPSWSEIRGVSMADRGGGQTAISLNIAWRPCFEITFSCFLLSSFAA